MMTTQRFIMKRSDTHPAGWVFADTETSIACEFEAHKWNETQHFVTIDPDRLNAYLLKQEGEHAQVMARLMSMYGDYVAQNFPTIVLPIDESMTAQYIGEQVKALREAKGWTYYQLAAKTGLQQTHVRRIEEGKYNIRVDVLVRLSAVLGEIALK